MTAAVPCARCGHPHDVRESTPPLLQFVKCDDGTPFLVGVKGKDTRGPGHGTLRKPAKKKRGQP